MKPLPLEKGEPFSEADLDRLEREAGWCLPSEYRSFAKRYGGAFVGGLVDGDESLPILSFDTVDQACRVSGNRSALPEEFPVSFAGCELGNLWMFDRSGCIHYINFYSRPAVSQKVAVDFCEFVRRIVVSDG